MRGLYTIGHSTQSWEQFLELLTRPRIEAIGDVRSSPYSARFSHFNRDILDRALRAANIRYVFLGDELGARRAERECYVEGVARYVLKEILDVKYVEAPLLAPTQPMLDACKKSNGSWDAYEHDFLKLMQERHIEDKIDPSLLDGGCLLCGEDTPHHCHRRLVLDYLQKRWGNLSIKHIV